MEKYLYNFIKRADIKRPTDPTVHMESSSGKRKDTTMLPVDVNVSFSALTWLDEREHI